MFNAGEIDKLPRAESAGLKLPADREQGDDTVNKKKGDKWEKKTRGELGRT